jgi:hypothetical protein
MNTSTKAIETYPAALNITRQETTKRKEQRHLHVARQEEERTFKMPPPVIGYFKGKDNDCL